MKIFSITKITLIIFLLILWLPLISTYLGFADTFSLNENREKSKLPNLKQMLTDPPSYEKYYRDNFGLRGFLIEANNFIKLKIFKSSTHNDVLVGKDDWLFYIADTNYLYIINATPLSETELQHIKQNLISINNYFQKRHIAFYLLIAPNKQSIYSEYLPPSLHKVRSDSQLDQITNFLEKSTPQIHFINPSDTLKTNKTYPTYYKYDTHWNSLGAFFAYQKLMQTINTNFPSTKPQKITDFNISYLPTNQKDLEILLGVKDYFYEKSPVFQNKNSTFSLATTPCKNPYEKCPEVTTQVKNLSLPKLVMYRDSFATQMLPFISEHFQKATYFWDVTPWPINIIDQEKPDIVIVELTERELWRLSDRLFVFQ